METITLLKKRGRPKKKRVDEIDLRILFFTSVNIPQKAIASHLHISQRQVESRIVWLTSQYKLSRVALVAYAIRNKMIE